MLPSMANVFRVQLSFGHGNGHHEEHAFNDTDSADSNLIVAPLTIFSFPNSQRILFTSDLLIDRTTIFSLMRFYNKSW